MDELRDKIRLEVGKSYDREDGEIVKIIYQQGNTFIGIIGIIHTDTNLSISYYNSKGVDSNNRPNFNLVREHSLWSNVKKNTLVVITCLSGQDNVRYFDKYKGGKVYCFYKGRTSYTSTLDFPSEEWHPNQVELYNEWH